MISVLWFGVLLRVRAAILFGGSREEAVSFAGENDPNYRGRKEETEREICGEAFEYYPSDEEGLYCSDCVQLENWRHRPAVTGENNLHWNGGKRENANYGSGWNAVREPDVHHLVPVRAFEAADRDPSAARRLDNVVAPCVRCHRKAAFGRPGRERLRALAGID